MRRLMQNGHVTEMEEYKKSYIEYLRKEKKMAINSCEAYGRDVDEFIAFVQGRRIARIEDVTNTDVVAYLHYLKQAGRSASTVNRKVASTRGFFRFLISKGIMDEDPTDRIKSPKIERKKVEYLSMKEIDQLLSCPDETNKGVRDRAILEVLYATGIRVSELIALDIEDINLRMGFVTCDSSSSKARIVPLGRPARAALENYVYDVRDNMVAGGKSEKALFVNHSGHRITRQGLWKILRDYGRQAGIEHRITPHTLRNSFAVHMLQNGADLKSLQELMGHDDITATQVYLSATKSRIKDVYDKTHPRA